MKTWLLCPDLSDQGFCGKANKTAKYCTMITKLADVISNKPYCMTKAGHALKSWIKGEYPEEPELEIDFLRLEPPRHLFAGNISLPPVIQPSCHDLQSNAQGLEPAMCTVEVTTSKAVRHKKPTETASDRAVFVYPLAVRLMSEHGCMLPYALETANKLWTKMPKACIEAATADVTETSENVSNSLDVEARMPCSL